MKRLVITISVLSFILVLGQRIALSQQEEKEETAVNQVRIDSLLDTYSIEEILQFRDYYQKQIDEIETEKYELRQKGIEDAEKFISQNPESRVLDKVLMRLAEWYFEEAEDRFIQELELYDKKLNQADSLIVQADLKEPVRDFSKSLHIYNRVIEEFPHSNLIDDAYYNKGFILEEIGEIDSALQIYKFVIDEFPESRYTPESMMRIAEYYFNPPQNNLDKAIEYYKEIIQFKESPKYNAALYRLGWSYYRLSDFAQAVSYFTLLVQDIQRTTGMDIDQRFSSPALQDEALEYIGLSFLEEGGIEGAAEYIKSLDTPDFGFDVIRKIGDVYMNEKEEYENAIAAFSKLLKLYPNHAELPRVHEKIVFCYRYLGHNRLTYLARDQLFNTYKPGSPWWLKHEKEETRDAAHEIAERAIRDNISLLFQQADLNRDQDLYRLAVADCKKYLRTFPTDSSASRIHWNMALTMDTKLKQYDDAFEEYMKLCDLYWDSKYQRYAAENAIALAKDAVESGENKISSRDSLTNVDFENIKGDVLSIFNYRPIPLTQNEKKLIRAYNNYIKFYPHEQETIKILSNAGALYFNNNLFEQALRNFNTIIKHFPDYEGIYDVHFQVLESYFGKGDYRSAEIVARRITKFSDVDDELKQRAQRRMAESIFLAAKVYSDSSDHLQAGNEYLRVVEEVPNVDFAALSLFNAAWEYDRAKEYNRAVKTYNYLIETRGESAYKYSAMNNMAIDYTELGEYKNAAITYERLSKISQDTTQIHDALYNSSVCFVQAREWEDAIRINQNFVNKFPDSEDSDDLFYDIATYYLRLDNLEKANEIYGEYAAKFPESPRVVETFFHRGKYYEDKEEFEKAITEYEKAVAMNDVFQQRSLETNDYFAAEALTKATMIRYKEFRAIEFTLPLAQMKNSKEKKKSLLIDIVDDFTKVASYGTIHLYEATFNIGMAYEEFAKTWARQEIQPMDRTRTIVTKKGINETTVELYRRAEESYRESIGVLKRLADEYERSLVENEASRLPQAEVRKIVERDSTLHIANKWIDRCEEKVSEVIFDMAELYATTVNDLLAAPIPPDLDYVAEMEYQKQLLNNVIKPLIDNAVEEYSRNIYESWKLGIENQWVKLSRKKIVSTNNLLAEEFRSLAHDALNYYEKSVEQYEQSVKQKDDINFGTDIIALSDQSAALINYSKDFAMQVVDIYKESLELSEREKIRDPSVTLTEENIFKDVYQFVLKTDSLIQVDNSKRKTYERLFRQTNEIEYEDALFSFEDNYFTLKENKRELLETVHQYSENSELKNRWSKRITLSLVEADPEEYCSLLDLSVFSKEMFTDDSWLASVEPSKDWSELDYDGDDFVPAEIITKEDESDRKGDFIWLSVIDTFGVTFDTTYVVQNNSDSTVVETAGILSGFVKDSTLADSMYQDKTIEMEITKKFQTRKVLGRRVFFRKPFFMSGLPVKVELSFKLDDSYNLLLNGGYIATFTAPDSGEIAEHPHVLSDGLVEGKNVIAVEGIDRDASGHGFYAEMKIMTVPEWEETKKKILLETSSQKIKENLAMDKYIILY